MAEFLADIAGVLVLFAIASGLIVLWRAGREAGAGLLRAAGLLLVVGGVAVGLCTTWYWIQYQTRGEFASAHMVYPGVLPPGMMVPGTGMMGPGTQAVPQDVSPTVPSLKAPTDTR
jgi:hypothetical protein